MTKIDIISGFLGAGKTTFIKKLLEEAIAGEKVVLIENEFGEIGIDGGFLQDSGIEIREMNSGCICCSLVGDFGRSLSEVLTKYEPDRVIIEPSGVGKLSDVMKAVCDVAGEIDVVLNGSVTVVDAQKCKMYMKNFGEFFNNQIESAGTIVLSRTDVADADKVAKAVELIREKNPKAAVVTTPIGRLTGAQLLEIIEKPTDDMAAELLEEVRQGHHHHEDEECCCGHDHEHHHHHHDHEDEECCCGHDHEHHHHHDHEEGECCCGHDHEHHHHHDHEDGECCCGHDHDHEEHEHHHHDHDEDEHEHHHHDHDGECCCGHDHDEEHEHHHHDHDDECCCGHDHDHEHHHHHDDECGCGHDHHHHHHADEVFTSWGQETVKTFTKEQIEGILKKLSEDTAYGMVLRAKGMVAGADGQWIYFDMVPEEYEVRDGAPEFTGRICVIGSKLAEDKLAELFGL